MGLGSALILGFTLGLRHALDADHVAAVSALVSRHGARATSWLLGAFWGVGHMTTVLLAGGTIILLRIHVPERLELFLEAPIGLILLVLGVLNMTGQSLGAASLKAHDHAHDHGDHRHGHPPDASPESRHGHPHFHFIERGTKGLSRLLENVGKASALRAVFVGLAHGLAGSAAVSLLILANFTELGPAFLYLLAFGLGTLLGMLVLSFLLEYCLGLLTRGWSSLERVLLFLTGLLSCTVGARMLYSCWRAEL